MQVTLTLTGPVPKWATKAKKDNLTDPDPKEFGAFATAIGRRYGADVSTWSIWNEPNQPQFLKPQYKSGKPASPKLYRKLYQAAYAGLRSTPDNARRHDPDRRDLAARQPERRAPARVPARDAVPGLQVPQVEVLRRAGGGRLRPPRVHDERRAALQAVQHRRRDDRRALAAHQRAGQGRQGGRAAEAPAGLPDRVRHPVDAGQGLRRVAGQAGGLPGDLRAHRVRQPACRGVLPVPAERRPAALRTATGTAASRAGCAAPTARPSRPTRASGCRWRSRSTGPATCSGASCARSARCRR